MFYHIGRRLKRGVPPLIAVALLLALAAFPAHAAEANPMLRIGLHYNTTAMASANLQNFTGSGYRFGYFQDGRQFVMLGSTQETKLTMLKNRNMYVSNGTYYESSPPAGSKTIGCYHIDTGVTYSDFTSAQAKANELCGKGFEAFPAYTGGAFAVRIGAYASSAAASADIGRVGISGAKALTGSAYCVSVVKTETGEMVFQFDGGAALSLGILPSTGEVAAPATWFKGYKYYGGFEYARLTGNDMTVINVVTMQDYIKGVVPYEMSPSWPLEALKAQALCAKSYAVNNMSKHKSYGFDLCATTDCQVYHGTNSATANSDRAVDETNGQYIYYGDKVAQTFYHSSNGGSTESAVNVWGTDYPYLRAVTDNFEDLSKATNGIWSFTYTNANITQILKDKGYTTANIVDAYVDEYTPAGNVFRVTFVDALGTKHSFEREKARTILNSASLGLYTHSQRYSISSGGFSLVVAGGSKTKTVTGTANLYAISSSGIAPVTGSASDIRLRTKNGISSVATVSTGQYFVSGRGWGHNVGLSQYGAKGMAEQGYAAARIIQYYFLGTQVK